jgi:foldase protein PrsA
MNKWVLPLTLAGVLTLSACNGNETSEAVVESDAGNITKDELYEAMKEKVGEQTLQELLYSKVLGDKYEVSDDEVNKRVEELKTQLGDNFELVLQQNQLEDEDALRDFLREQMLIEKAALKDVEVSEEEVKQRYEEYQPEIKASHILVEDEAKAKELKSELDGGADFAELAKENSTDPGSAEKGGDLGFFGPGAMVPEFEEAAYALKVNEISDPVQSQHGWHIIKVTEKKEKESYEDMKEELEYELKLTKVDATKLQATLQDELKDANVKIKDKDLQGVMETPETPEAPKQ